MKNTSSVEKQLDFLKLKGVEVQSEDKIVKFLSDLPFQKTIKQLNIYYSKNRDEYNAYNCYKGVKEVELIARYNSVWEDSIKMLDNILRYENEIKNLLFSLLLELYESDDILYRTIVHRIIPLTIKAAKFGLDIEDVSKDEIKTKEMYCDNLYKVINACSMGEIKEILNQLYHVEDISKLVEFHKLRFHLNGNTKMAAYLSILNNKEYNRNLLDNDLFKNEVRNEIKKNFQNIIFKAIIQSKFPIDIALKDETSLISLISKSKLKSFFKDNSDELTTFYNDFDKNNKKSVIKKAIRQDEFINQLGLEIFDLNSIDILESTLDLIVKKDIDNLQVDLNNTNIILVINDIYQKEIQITEIQKLFSVISLFRNIISHGNTLLLPLKKGKEKQYIECLFNSIFSDEKAKEYTNIMYKISN